MAYLVHAALQNRGVQLNRTAFAYGNIAPDYIPSMVLNPRFYPHFSRVCEKTINEFSEELSSTQLTGTERVNADYSKKLGILCHYICDYFCFAHSKDFLGGVRQHIDFENSLDQYLRENCTNLLDIEGKSEVRPSLSAAELVSRLNSEKNDYTNTGYTFENDLSYAFDACVAAVLSLVKMSQKQEAKSRAYYSDQPFPQLRGFETGDCYVFRMFFFKHRNCDLFFLPEIMQPISA